MPDVYRHIHGNDLSSMSALDAFLNRITPYRLTMQGLGLLAIVAITEAFLGWLPYTALQLSVSLIVLLFSSFVVNSLCALYTGSTSARESSYVTAFILFFALSPLASSGDALLLMAAATTAILSKYVLAWKGRHIFNPAAVGIFALMISGSGMVAWWVATITLVPFVIILGFILVRKLHCEDIVWPFFLAAGVVIFVESLLRYHSPLSSMVSFVEITPVIFVGVLMLTDPQTMPTLPGSRSMYGAIAGMLFPLSLTVGGFLINDTGAGPIVSILAANVFGYTRRLRRRVSFAFHSSTQLSRNIHEFTFVPDEMFPFAPGQYVEVTIPHKKSDARGVRRQFHLTSVPGDPHIRFATTLSVEGSTYKDALRALIPEKIITAVHPSGESLISNMLTQPIGIIADGIGIAAFIGMFRYLAHVRERRDIVLIYSALSPLDFGYKDELDSIKNSIGLSIYYLPIDFTELTSWNGPSGFITSTFVQENVPDFASRAWYVAGPSVTTDAAAWLLRSMSVPRNALHSVLFDGF